ncbi:MAG TPA: M1 family metallopeptidase [Edaphocola sp.]|nr:M1 family metallopeptidase [Edaphocola sp.]
MLSKPIFLLFLGLLSFSQLLGKDCKTNSNRTNFNVLHYRLAINFDTLNKKLDGTVQVKCIYTATQNIPIQIDAQSPLKITKVTFNERDLHFQKTEDGYLVNLEKHIKKADTFSIVIHYEGTPRLALNAPWDGGSIVQQDNNGKLWWAIACQGLGASIWFPCKDMPDDEPEEGVELFYTIPNNLSAIGNGRLMGITPKNDQQKTWHWSVKSPINLYDITFYIGDYVHWQEEMTGLSGKLDLDYYVLNNHLEVAKKHFEMVPEMIRIFEDWMGPYPFYQDGYKLVEAPYLGMEHQSAVAYGNQYQNGYLGKDRSNTGIGNLFDFVIVHESGHEWFGNNISIKNNSDFWIHEGFTSYTEVMYIDSKFGKKKALEYLIGTQALIKNKIPLINTINSCHNSNTDNYPKGASLIHILRTLMKDDVKFKQLLHKMNQQFFHKTVTSKEIENFIIKESGLKLDKIFDQYLRQSNLPTLSIKKSKNGFSYQWKNCVKGFDMPIKLMINGKEKWLYPDEKQRKWKQKNIHTISKDPAFYCDFNIK